MYKGIHACFFWQVFQSISRRDFFQIFCMFYLQCITRKCAKEKNFDIQRNSRVGSGGQFTSNRLSNDHMYWVWHIHHFKNDLTHYFHHHTIDSGFSEIRAPVRRTLSKARSTSSKDGQLKCLQMDQEPQFAGLVKLGALCGRTQRLSFTHCGVSCPCTGTTSSLPYQLHLGV